MSERYVLLLRESDPRGAEAACASQQHALEKEVATRGGHVVAVVSDLGYSGALLDRPAIDELMDLAERKAMDVVLCTELARLSRAEPAGYYVLRAELARCGVRLEFLDQTWSDDEDDEAAPLLEGIAVALPRMERQRISRRFRRGRERVWADGFHWASVPPYGYRYHAGGHAAGRWEIHETEAGWLREMYARAGAGWTLGQIARWLTAEGVPTRKGGQWWPYTVSCILQNPLNYGLLASRKEAVRARRPYVSRPSSPSTGTQGKGRRQPKSSQKALPAGAWRGKVLRPELAIVDKETFDQAARARQTNLRTSPRRTREPSLLHGLVLCGCHDAGSHRMAYQNRDGRPPAWRCPHRAAPGAPYCKSYARADLLEAAVWTRLVQIATEPDALLSDMVNRLAQQHALEQKAQRRISTARAAVHKAEDALNRAAVAYYGGELEQERYDYVRCTYEEQRAEARRALAAAEEEARHWSPIPLDAAALCVERDGLVMAHVAAAQGHAVQVVQQLIRQALGDPRTEQLEALSREEKRRRIRSLVEAVVVEGKTASMVCALSGKRDTLHKDDSRGLYLNEPVHLIFPLSLAA